MTEAIGRAQRNALGLLLAGYSPEEVEAILEGSLPYPEGYTALTDPNNVQLKVVRVKMAQPTARGPVNIMGVTTRHNTSEKRTCICCLHRIRLDGAYERVMRLSGDVESYHVFCFEQEFGARSLYGE